MGFSTERSDDVRRGSRRKPDRRARATPDAASTDATISPDIGPLVRRAAAAESDDDEALVLARTQLWRAAFSMPSWLLIASDIDGVVRPHVRYDGERGAALAFTDSFAALRYQAERGLTFRQGFVTIEIAIDALLEKLHETGATDLLLNDGSEAFGAPIAMLERLRRHVEHGNDREAIDSTVVRIDTTAIRVGPRLAAAAKDPNEREAALTALFGLPHWWFICNPRQPDAFHVRRFALPEGGAPTTRQAVVAFTEHRLAMEATERYALADEEGSIVLMEMPASDAVEWLQSFRDHDVDVVMFDALTTPFPVRISELPEEWRSRHPERARTDAQGEEASQT